MAKGRGENSDPTKQPAPDGAPLGGEESLYDYADRLAADQAVDSEEVPEEPESWISFRVAGSIYGLMVDVVREVLRVGVVTAVPHTPAFVRGVTNMRGRVLPVVDLRVRLGFETAPISESSRILVVRLGSELVGLLVDAVQQMLQILPSNIREPPAEGSSKALRSVSGMTALEEGVMLLLDSKSLLAEPEVSLGEGHGAHGSA